MSDEVNIYKIPGYNIFSYCNNNYRAQGVICYIYVSQASIKMETADTLLLSLKYHNEHVNLIC